MHYTSARARVRSLASEFLSYEHADVGRVRLAELARRQSNFSHIYLHTIAENEHKPSEMME